MVNEHYKLVIAAIYIGYAMLEFATGRFLHRDTSTRRDIIMDLVSAMSVPLIIIPTILWFAPTLAQWLWPGSQGALGHLSWWAMFGILLIADDMTQYWWHRLSHTRWLYPLHRAHHSAGYMSIRIVYRNNLLYYAMMPGLWLSGMLIYWGFGPVYAVYAIFKLGIIIAAHSSVPWDEPLYRHPIGARVMWFIERLISTPSTHAAHHGLNLSDGVTHYHGNYGNMLFIWDILFGTAKITRRRPDAYGIEALAPIPLLNEMLLPVPLQDQEPK